MLIAISEIASRHLEQWLDDLMQGRLELYQLPSPIRGFYDLGLIDGRAAATGHLTERIAYLEHENDRLHVLAHNKGDERRDEILRRLDEQAAREADLIMNEMHKQLLGGNADSGRAVDSAAESSEHDSTRNDPRSNIHDSAQIHRAIFAA